MMDNEKMEYNALQNGVWKTAAESNKTLQGTVRCSWAPVFVPLGKQGLITRLFVLSSKRITSIETAVEKELEWLNSPGGSISPWGVFVDDKNKRKTYDSMLGKENFFNHRTLHVGRLTDAALQQILGIHGGYYAELMEKLTANPYVLYRPDRFTWTKLTWTKPDGFGRKREEEVPIPGNSEPEQKRNNTLLLGFAASAALALINN